MALYIATHKPAQMPSAPWLKPIGVGGFSDASTQLNDAQGDNIAALNRQYCELTATYWLWKHCRDPYVGLCHYRRYFSFVPLPVQGYQSLPIVKAPLAPETLSFLASAAQEQRLESLLEHFEMVVPHPVPEYPSIASSYRAAHGDAVWNAFRKACRREFGAVAGLLDVETRFYCGNMVVAHAKVFDDYCKSLFKVLGEVVEEMGVPEAVPGDVRYQPYRYPGYLAERFTSLYLSATRTRFTTVQALWFE
ncbi:DUF4422 domain-containing protein [Azohydromonas lata]|uniref:DUF4422 domain-containing protein n=1 Tax=Azohydromonas lata TaxID=45677 RepID=UPI00083620E9|nr:DUF4422 domain-containing protein [Azohydromonas lata]